MCPDINSARESGSAYFSRLKKHTKIAELPKTTKNESFMEKYSLKKNNAPKKVEHYIGYQSQKHISNVSCLWKRHPQILSKMVPPAFNSGQKRVAKKNSNMIQMFYGDSQPKSETESSCEKPTQSQSSLSMEKIN